MNQAGAVFIPIMPDFAEFDSPLRRHLSSMHLQVQVQVNVEIEQRQFEQAMDQVETRAEKTMNGLKKIGAVAGAAMGGALSAGLAGALQLDNARGKLQAQLGLTKTESARAGDIAGQLYAKSYGESMEDVQGAITAVIQNMDGMRSASSASLKDTTAKAMTLSSVLDEEVGATTSAVAQMLRTGLAKNATEAFDILTKGAQSGANKAQDLLDTFNEYGTQFRKLGLDGSTAMGLISQGLKAGARDADLVADSLKEFSIRAIDGSASTVQGFKDLGLNASQMAAQIAKGGPAASRGLQAVLEKLRAIKDPVKQSQIAVSLFGTQAEDMGQALYRLDPSKATAALGQFKGATDAAGKALHETTQARFEGFKRSLQQNVQGAVVSTVGWFQRHETTTKALAVAAGILTLAWAGYNAVALVMAARTALMTEGTVAHLIVTKAARVATLAWAGVQWVLNAALSANPIGLVVLAIAALVGGVILAYNKIGWFRDGVNAVFGWLKTALITVINFVKNNWRLILTILIGPFGLAIALITKYWSQIKSAVSSAVTWVINWVRSHWRLLITILGGPIGLAIALITKYWGRIKSAFSAAVNWVLNWVRSHWRLLITIIGGPIGAAVSLVTKHWGRIKSATTSMINSVKAGISRGMSAIRNSFSTAVTAIGRTWDRIRNATRSPVNFVIGTVYNRGIVDRLWNPMVQWLHLDKFKLGHAKLLAQGGTITDPMPVRPMVTNRPTAIVGEGRPQHPEFVIPSDPRFKGRATALWQAAGRSLGMDGPQMLAKGGIIGDLIGGVKKVAGKVSDIGKNALDLIANPKKVWDRLASPVLNQAKSIGAGPYGKAIAAIPPKMVGEAWKVASRIISTFASSFGGNANAVVTAAKSQLGVPYSWGGGGPGGPSYGIAQGAGISGFDCSSLMQYAYWKGAHKRLSRTTYTQVHEGRPVGSRGALRPGDLVFPHPGHVMMVATPRAKGGAGMVEAPHTGAHVRMAAFRGMAAGARRIMEGLGSGGGSVSGSPKAFARAQFGQFGWGANQWSPLEMLWERESNWQWNARNRSSGAYGIPQALPASKMASAGADWLTNWATQIRWGLGYIRGRYGSPAAAWAHSQRTGWYDEGGYLPPGLSLVMNKTGRPEPVLNPRQWDAIERGVGGQQPLVGNLTIQTPEKATAEDVGREVRTTVRKIRMGTGRYG